MTVIGETSLMPPASHSKRRGSQSWWSTIHQRYAPRLAVIIKREMPATVQRLYPPDDIFQMVFLRAWERRDRLQDPESPTMAYHFLVGIALRVIREAVRAAAVRRIMRPLNLKADSSNGGGVAPELLATWTHASRAVLQSEAVTRALAILSQASPRNAQIFYWFHYLDLSHREIARRLDIDEAAARQRMHRARLEIKRIGRVLEEHHGPVAIPHELED